jgi:hypothetical protein
MTTIHSDFPYWRFSQKNVTIIFLAKTSSSLEQGRQFFGENVFLVIASVPGLSTGAACSSEMKTSFWVFGKYEADARISTLSD